MLFLLLVQEDLDLKVRINFTHKFSNFEMSLYNVCKNVLEASLNISDILTASKIPSTPSPIELEKCYLNENDTKSGETVSNKFLNYKIIKNDKPVTFSLDKEYLEKITNKLYVENVSKISSIPDDNNLILETNSKDYDIIIEQKESKTLTRCVIVNKIDGYIKKYENLKSFRILWQLCEV